MYKKILLTLDGSSPAEAAIPHAEAMVKAFGSHLTLLYVVEPIGIHPEPGVGPTLTACLNVDEDLAQGQEYLNKIAESLSKNGVLADTVVRDGPPASRICSYAHENSIDLIVMSTHGRSGFQKLFYGSVADKVLRGAKSPILLIRVEPQNNA